jgi:hypothetical protein
LSRALFACALAALLLVPAAAGHGGGIGPKGFQSTVTAIEPEEPGFSVTVLDRDDRLRLENTSGKTIVIEGYDGEPYLRFTKFGVSSNQRSPAIWLNDDRFGGGEIPESADSKAPPLWVQVSDGRVWEWHDHRAHWMSPIPPPKIQQAPDEAQHVFDWRVPVTVDGERAAIVGSLDYVPVDEGMNWAVVASFAVGVLTLAAAVLVVFWRRGEAK